MNTSIDPAALSLAALSLEYCKAVAAAGESGARLFLRDVLRYLPRIYITLSDLKPYGSDSDDVASTDAIYASVDEEHYNGMRTAMARVLGEYDMYLDTPVEQMQYSDTPVAVSLAENLADIYQNLADYAAVMAQTGADIADDIIADIKARFNEYLSDTICNALRAANYIYRNADFQ